MNTRLGERDERAFNALVDEIMGQGYDEETAAKYAALIGDLPITNDAGQVLVMEGGRVVAKLRALKFYEAR